MSFPRGGIWKAPRLSPVSLPRSLYAPSWQRQLLPQLLRALLPPPRCRRGTAVWGASELGALTNSTFATALQKGVTLRKRGETCEAFLPWTPSPASLPRGRRNAWTQGQAAPERSSLSAELNKPFHGCPQLRSNLRSLPHPPPVLPSLGQKNPKTNKKGRERKGESGVGPSPSPRPGCLPPPTCLSSLVK